MAIASIAVWSQTASSQTLGVAVGTPGTLFNNVGTAIARQATTRGIPMVVQPSTSPTQYLPFISNAGVEFGVSNLQEVDYSYEGKEWFAGKASPNLRVVANLMPLREAVYVKDDSPIKTMADLKGHRLPSGFTANATIVPQLAAHYATAGLTEKDFKSVLVPSVVGNADAFIAGRTDAFIFALGAAKVKEADAAVGGVRALLLENTPETLAALRSHWPVADLYPVKAGKDDPMIKADGYIMSYPVVLVANKDVPAEKITAVLDMLTSDKSELTKLFKPFALMNPDTLYIKDSVTPYHPAAVDYYNKLEKK